MPTIVMKKKGKKIELGQSKDLKLYNDTKEKGRKIMGFIWSNDLDCHVEGIKKDGVLPK